MAVVKSRLQELRKSHSITQSELCRALGCDQSLYSKYERAERSIPVEFIIKLAKYYGVTTDYLLYLSKYKTSAPQDDNT